MTGSYSSEAAAHATTSPATADQRASVLENPPSSTGAADLHEPDPARARRRARGATASSLNCARPLCEVVSAAACSPPPWSGSNPASAHSDTRGETCDSAERIAASAVVRERMRAREAARGARGERVAGNGHRAPFKIVACAKWPPSAHLLCSAPTVIGVEAADADTPWPQLSCVKSR